MTVESLSTFPAKKWSLLPSSYVNEGECLFPIWQRAVTNSFNLEPSRVKTFFPNDVSFG